MSHKRRIDHQLFLATDVANCQKKREETNRPLVGVAKSTKQEEKNKQVGEPERTQE
jgi:hypothetical protein